MCCQVCGCIVLCRFLRIVQVCFCWCPECFVCVAVSQIQLLQDRVPPFSCEVAREVMTQTFRRPLEEVLESISDRPVAAASLGQARGSARLLLLIN